MNAGDRVRVSTLDGLEFEGVVLPADHLVLKLDDGYNVGFSEQNIKSSEVIAPSKRVTNRPQGPVPKSGSGPKIVIIHTGGTIASKVDYATGGVTNLITPDEILGMYPELQGIADVKAELLHNMSTEDFRFAHFNLIARAVERRVGKADGIIVTMGTDQMHYAAAALHYSLQNLPIPVVITGSQRSADRGSTDAALNLACAARFIAQNPMSGVFVAMHEHSDDTSVAVMRAINVRKMHTARRDAFKPVNLPIIARVTDAGVELVTRPPVAEGDFSVVPFDEDLKIGMCYVHPQFFPEEFELYREYDGLIIIGTGLGAAPINVSDTITEIGERNKKALEKLLTHMPVVMASQCIHGRISLQVYSSNRRLQEMGVLGHDLAFTPETAFIKLAHLLSRRNSGEDIDIAHEYYADHGDSIPRTEERAYE